MAFTWKSIWVLQPKISSHYIIVNVWIGQKDVSSAQKLTTFFSQLSGWNALGKLRVFFSLGKRVMGITLNFAKVTRSCVFLWMRESKWLIASQGCGFIRVPWLKPDLHRIKKPIVFMKFRVFMIVNFEFSTMDEVRELIVII